MESMIVLPGQVIPASALPDASSNKPLTIGPGLRHIPPRTIVSSTAGLLSRDAKKNALWMESNSGRYIPTAGDLVVCTVRHSGPEIYYCTITPYSANATLGQLSFESATKKTRPILPPNSLVYARVVSSNRDLGVELTCVHPATGKSDGLGPLKGGTIFNISLGMARRLMLSSGKEGSIILLDALAEKSLSFEIAVGRNGVVWVDAGGDVKRTLQIGRALVEIDENGLDHVGQRKLVEKVLRD